MFRSYRNQSIDLFCNLLCKTINWIYIVRLLVANGLICETEKNSRSINNLEDKKIFHGKSQVTFHHGVSVIVCQ